MKKRRGVILAECIIACLAAAIALTAAAHLVHQAGLLVITAYDNHHIERDVSTLTSRLLYKGFSDMSDHNDCVVELIGVAGGIAKYRLSRPALRDVSERFVLWPAVQ